MPLFYSIKSNKSDRELSKVINFLIISLLLALSLFTQTKAQTINDNAILIVIPRGSLNYCTWNYIYDTLPNIGWESDLIFNASTWLLGMTPIGMGDFYKRTNINFLDLYLRKVFHVETIPSSAILSIASDDGVDAWINGMKVLIDIDSLHGSSYWNYRLNITDYLKVGDNLLAVHVKNGGGNMCYFDSELLFKQKSLQELIFNFIKGRENADGGFQDEHMDVTFYATSMLKALGGINDIVKNKTMLWIMSHKFLYGDFGYGVSWQDSAIESLKNIGITLDNESVERLSAAFYNWQSNDGIWNSALGDTNRMIEALASLRALNEVEDWSRTISFISSLQNIDGSFKNQQGDTYGFTRYTYYAIRSLYLLNATNFIDKDKTITYLLSCYKGYAFSDRPDSGTWIAPTFWAIESLAILNSIGRIDAERLTNRILSWQRPESGFGNPEYDYYLVMTLQILGKMNELDKSKFISNVLNYLNPIDGGSDGRVIYIILSLQ